MNADHLARCASGLTRTPVRVSLCLLAATLLATPAAAQRSSALNNILFEPQPLVDTTPRALPGPVVFRPNLTAPDLASDAGTGIDSSTADDYLESIAATVLADGPYAPALLEQYLALGESYQQRNDHEAALAALDKADHISRINNGLYSPEQFAIVENMIESHLARGELFEAAGKERYLLSLHEQEYGLNSLELVPALANVGDWNLTLFNRQLKLPNTVFSIGFNSGPGGRDMSPRMVAFGSLYQSQENYWRAINIMLRNGRYSDPQLHDLEAKLIETSFLNSYRDGLLRNPDFYLTKRYAYTGTRVRRSARPNSPFYYTGRSAYERLMAYHVMTEGTDAVSVAQTLIALGDWNLLFEHQGTAIKTYRRAHDFMVSSKVPQATIDALLSPTIPQQLPVFTALPNSRAKLGIAPDAAVNWDGYVDVSFKVMRFGQVQNFEVLGSSGPLTKEMRDRLRLLVRSSPFRPRFVDGAPAVRDQVSVRYYYAQLD
jgi:tetratricopeptide (TPR) repeat protein